MPGRVDFVAAPCSAFVNTGGAEDHEVPFCPHIASELRRLLRGPPVAVCRGANRHCYACRQATTTVAKFETV